ncbi:PLDc N-terminal domain-containing protein [Inquilinus limosus]
MDGMNGFWTTYWSDIVLAASLVLGAAGAVHAIMTKDDVRAATGWVGVIVLNPILGAVIYLVLGVNRVRRAAIARRRRRSGAGMDDRETGPEVDVAAASAPQFASLQRLGDRVSPFAVTAGNELRLLQGGDEAYPAMLEAIRGARSAIALQSYIFDNDPVGREIAGALIEAARRGVEVRVLIDGIGARYSRPQIVGVLRAGGVRTARFMGNVIGLKLPYANLRCHRKLLVVDGETAFTGGMNIRAQFSSAHADGPVGRDVHARIRGPLVQSLLTAFVQDWRFTTGERLHGQAWRSLPRPLPAPSVLARAILSGPDVTLGSNHSLVMGAIAVAQRSIRICSPYFLPDLSLTSALAIAAQRGVEVDIVIPSVNNLALIDFAMTAQLDQVLRPGCRVWRATGPFDHSKLMAVDGAWALIGSSNLDSRSLRLNFELDVEIYDRGVAGEIDAAIRQRIATARPETLDTLRARPFLTRLRNRTVWLASPYL